MSVFKRREQTTFQAQQGIETYDHPNGWAVTFTPKTGWVVLDRNGATKTTHGYGDQSMKSAFAEANKQGTFRMCCASWLHKPHEKHCSFGGEAQ